MKKYFKKNLLKLCTLATVLCTTASVGAVMASAEESTQATGKSLSEVSFTMMNGASIRTDGTGIRFSALLSQDDYDGLTVQYGEDLEFGTFIMAAKYLDSKSGGAFTEEQFFGDYDNDDTTTSIYTWEGATVTEDRVQILQMESTAYLDTKENAMRVNGSVTRVYDNNLDMDYIGVCYIKAGTEYKLASLNNNVRNVVYVSQLAVAKSESADFVSAGQAVIDHYTTLADAVTSVNYTVNTYIHNYETGAVEYGEPQEYTAELNESVSLNDIASTITATDGTYNYVASRSTTSGVAYIGDKLTLDLYYHKKAGGVLYDFYDTKEASQLGLNGEKNGKYAQLNGYDTIKFAGATNSEGQVLYEDADNILKADESVAPLLTTTDETTGETTEVTLGSAINYVYVTFYIDSDWAEGEYLYFKYKKSASSGFTTYPVTDGYLQSKRWLSISFPLDSSATTLNGIGFSFSKYSSGSYPSVGNLYIKEIGVIAKSEMLRDDFYVAGQDENTAMLSFLYPTSTNYNILLDSAASSNPTLLAAAETAGITLNGNMLVLRSNNRWPKYQITTAAYNWLKAKGYTKMTMDIYVDGTIEKYNTDSTNVLGTTSNPTYPINEKVWQTITVTITSSRYIYVQKTSAVINNIYVDNIRFS